MSFSQMYFMMKGMLLFPSLFFAYAGASVVSRNGIISVKEAGIDVHVDSSAISQQRTISSLQSKSFEITQREMSWSEALTFCKERHGNLATIRSPKEMELIRNMSLQTANYLSASPPWYLWIGGTKIGSSRGFYWISDGRTFSFSDWYSGYPTTDSGADCVQQYYKDGRWGWINHDCAQGRFPVCEYFFERESDEVDLF